MGQIDMQTDQVSVGNGEWGRAFVAFVRGMGEEKPCHMLENEIRA